MVTDEIISFLSFIIYTMFLRKQSWKDFGNFIKATKVETALLKETNKFLKKATNLNPLMKWYKKKFWTVSPKWLLIEAEIKQINIQIDGDGIHIQGMWSDGVTYDEFAFFDYESAKDMAQLVAGTYAEQLKSEIDFYQDMIEKSKAALEYAKLPPEWKKNAMLPDSDTVMLWGQHTKEPAPVFEVGTLETTLSSNTTTTWKKQNKQSKKKAQ